MKHIFIIFAIILVNMIAAPAQTEITIKKKTSIKIPGREIPQMPMGMKNPLENQPSVVYVKGSRMRTDVQSQIPGKFGMETVTSTIIRQCDKQQALSFTSKKKEYHIEPFSGQSSTNIKNSKKGGYVTMTGSVVDTGERATLFGYEARHLKQTLTVTPSQNACQQGTLQVEIEGWYAEIPEYSCPIKRKPQEFQTGSNCFDEIVDELKGAVTGIALKEIKKVTSDGLTVVVEEEATSLTKTPLADSLFEPPTGYKAINLPPAVTAGMSGNSSTENTSLPLPSVPTTMNSSSSFPPPTAGLESSPAGEKKTGIIRVGIAKPKVKTPDSKHYPEADSELADAVTRSLLDSLKAENVEAVQLETDFPENECREKGCDYIFYANVTQKRNTGGMFKSMIVMGAATAAGAMIPGVGGIIASTAGGMIMGKTMEKAAKAKDEFTLEYKAVGLDKSVLSQSVSKKKTEKDGADVLSPQLQEASKAVLAEIIKKKSTVTP